MKERILIKLSGEALMGDTGYGIDVSTINFISKEIKKIAKLNYEICLIIGVEISLGALRGHLKV